MDDEGIPMIRKPAVAGQFYFDTPNMLKAQVESCIEKGLRREKVIGMLSPHAGFVYSGAVAGALYSRIEFPQTFVIIGPNHTGLGKPISIMASGEWDMPNGTVMIDENLSEKILKSSDRIEDDTYAHLREHSLEVQIPFMQFFSKDFSIVPISIMTTSLEDCLEVGRALAEVIKVTTYPVVIVASSDMTHYEPDESARKKDRKALDRVLALDPEGLHRTVLSEKITMCGFSPTVTMLKASILLGAKSAVLVKYMTSGDTSGDYSHVVGYAGVLIK